MAGQVAGVISGLDEENRGRFAAIVPSTVFGDCDEAARRIVFLIDRSGSMSGAPMDQARASVLACLDAMSSEDRFGIIAFDTEIEATSKTLVLAGIKARNSAKRFLGSVDARGGTELLSGLEAAITLLGKEGGDVLLLTDGEVWASESITQAVSKRPVRVHCLGIGSASRERFLAELARQTGGICRYAAPSERVDMAALELFAAIGRPVATDLTCAIEGLSDTRIEPSPAGRIFMGSPLVVFGSCAGPGTGRLSITGKRGDEKVETNVELTLSDDRNTGLGSAIKAFQGAKLITEAESRFPTHSIHSSRGAGKRTRDRAVRQLIALSQTYGLANREMSLVAVIERVGDVSGELPVTQVIPVGFEPETIEDQYVCASMPDPSTYMKSSPDMDLADGTSVHAFNLAYPPASSGSRSEDMPTLRPLSDSMETSGLGIEDLLVELAGRIQPDGGLDGNDPEERILASLLVLLVFSQQGHTPSRGAFAPHARRLRLFIEAADLAALVPERQALVTQGLQWRSTDIAGEDWLRLITKWLIDRTVGLEDAWKHLEAVLDKP